MNKFFTFLSILFATSLADAQWMQTNGPPGGGRVQSLIILGDTVLSGVAGNGVFMSTTSGEEWDQVDYDYSFSEPSLFITKDQYVFAGTAGGVFRSADGGLHWTETNIGMPAYPSIAVMAVNGEMIVAGTTRGSYFMSDNNGDTWLGVSLAQPYPQAMVALNSTLYVGSSGSGVRKSSNNGATWTETNNGLTDLNVQALAILGTSLLAGTYQHGVFISNDNGDSWKTMNTGMPELNIRELVVYNNIVYALNSYGIFRSINSSNWTSVNSGLPADVSVISLAASGTNVFAGLDGAGIYHSVNNGSSWTATAGLPCTAVKSLTTYNSAIFAGTSGKGLFKSTDNGLVWTKSNSGIPEGVSIDALAVQGTTLFSGTSGGLFKSVNNGNSWTESLPGYWVQALATSGSSIYAAAYYGGVFKSVNEGGSWAQLNNGLPGPPVIAIAVSGSTLFAGTYGSGVYRSMDNGNSWISVNSGLNDNVVTSFAVFGSTVLAGTYSGLYITSNNGTLWTQVAYGDVHTLALHGSTLFAGSYSGASMSTDTGKTWTMVNEGLIRQINVFAFIGPNVFAGTSGSGVFINTTLLTGTADEIRKDQQASLYPNPATGAITFEIPAIIEGGILSIYNLSGQPILSMEVDELLTTIDIRNLPSGLYFVRYGNHFSSRVGRFVKE